MAKLTGEKPENYLPASAIAIGGVYLAQNDRAYRVSRISGPHITCHMLRKTGGETKYAHTGVYGYSIFFTKVIEAPPAPVKAEPERRERWTNNGRTVSRDDQEMFTLHRQEMAPVEMDQMVRRIVRMLNAVESE